MHLYRLAMQKGASACDEEPRNGLIGMIGGLFPPSTVDYYNHMNTLVRQRLGGQHCANVLVFSVDHHPMVKFAESGQWDRLAERLVEATQALERAGAECVIIACNSVHKVFDEVERQCGSVGGESSSGGLRLIHIGDPLASELAAAGCTKTGLLGTRYTLEADWLHDRLRAHGVVGLLPEPEQLDKLHDTVLHELNDVHSSDAVRPETLALYRAMMKGFADKGATGVVLGCTELRVLAQADEEEVRRAGQGTSTAAAYGLLVFDTAQLHCVAAVDHVLSTRV